MLFTHNANMCIKRSMYKLLMYWCVLQMYLQNRMKWRKCWLLRPVIQIVLFIIAYYTSISRISDYMHHWSDVLGGSVLGIAVSILVVSLI
jgi:phosphatidate phosphatase